MQRSRFIGLSESERLFCFSRARSLLAGCSSRQGISALSLSGFFTGSGADGKNDVDKRLLDAIDFVTALLLIVNELQVIGTYITTGRFTIVVSGPLFGSEPVEGYTPTAREFARDFGSLVTTVIRPF